MPLGWNYSTQKKYLCSQKYNTYIWYLSKANIAPNISSQSSMTKLVIILISIVDYWIPLHRSEAPRANNEMSNRTLTHPPHLTHICAIIAKYLNGTHPPHATYFLFWLLVFQNRLLSSSWSLLHTRVPNTSHAHIFPEYYILLLDTIFIHVFKFQITAHLSSSSAQKYTLLEWYCMTHAI